MINWVDFPYPDPEENSAISNLDFTELGDVTDVPTSTYIFECETDHRITDVLSSGIITYANVTDYAGIVEVYAKCYYDPEAYDAYLYPYMENFKQDLFNQ